MEKVLNELAIFIKDKLSKEQVTITEEIKEDDDGTRYNLYVANSTNPVITLWQTNLNEISILLYPKKGNVYDFLCSISCGDEENDDNTFNYKVLNQEKEKLSFEQIKSRINEILKKIF